MPTYEYACSNCETTHEVQQSMSDPSLTDCPACGESTLRKLFRGVGIHFKGSGFYRTDSRGSASKSDSSATSTAAGSSSTSSSTSSSASTSGSSSSSTTSTTSTTSTAAAAS